MSSLFAEWSLLFRKPIESVQPDSLTIDVRPARMGELELNTIDGISG